MQAMFRGVHTGNVDDKGRLKLPASVKRRLKDLYSQLDIFVTSLDGETVKVFPIREWELVEDRLADKSKSSDQAQTGAVKNRILFQANRFGAEETLDGQGRLLVPSALRESADMKGAVKIQWQSNHMLVMSEARYNDAAEQNMLTADDLAHAADLGL